MMRLRLLMLFSFFYLVAAKSNVKALTESMGQEVIEIKTPIKELPLGLDEEPSADEDDDDKQVFKSNSNPSTSTTKRDSKKTTALARNMKVVKDVDKIDGITQDDEEDRIEKELAEIYKDTADYKSDDEAISKESPAPVEQLTEEVITTEQTEKPIARQRNNFKLQPDSTDKASIEKFRTSVDEINCYDQQKLFKRVTTPGMATKNAFHTAPGMTAKNAFHTVSNGIILLIAVVSYVFICT